MDFKTRFNKYKALKERVYNLSISTYGTEKFAYWWRHYVKISNYIFND